MEKSTLILLLCRKKNTNIINRYNFFKNHNLLTYIIEDNKNIPNNFYGLTHIGSKDKTTAWESAFFYLFNLENIPDFVYLIEDDVYSHENNTFIKLIDYYSLQQYALIAGKIYSKEESSDWHWWKADNEHKIFSNPYRSFNPLCRLSKELIFYIRDHHKIYNRFFYHEFLFSSLAKQNNLLMCDYNKDNNGFIGNIIYRPVFIQNCIVDNKIYHPVKKYASMDDTRTS